MGRDRSVDLRAYVCVLGSKSSCPVMTMGDPAEAKLPSRDEEEQMI